MNQTPVEAREKPEVRIDLVPFSDLPGQSTLFVDFQANSQLIDNYFPEKHKPAAEFAEDVLRKYTVDRETLCDALLEINKALGARIKTFINIEFLRRKDCVAVVTGGHTGLFLGPAATVYKVLSAVKAAIALRDQNINAVPVFWMFEEEHNFENVNKTCFLDKFGGFREVQNTPEEYAENLPVGFVSFDETIEKTINDLFAELAPTDHSGDLKKLLAQCYKEGESFGSAFGRLLLKLFGTYGLVVLSPLNARIKRLAAPIIETAVEKSNEINSALQQIGRILKGENYHLEVPVGENAFPFFLQSEDGQRRSLERDPETGVYKVENSSAEFERSELLRLARTKPQYLSQNELIRPVIQDYLLPTILYFGSSEEIAYSAQNAVIYEILNRPVTPIRRASSFTIVSGEANNSIDNYQLEFRDLVGGKEHFISVATNGSAPAEAARVFSEVEEVILAEINRLKLHFVQTDPNLAENVDHWKWKLVTELAALKNEYLSAGSSREHNSNQRLENIFDSLFPANCLQEDRVNVITFLNHYGLKLVDLVYDAVSADESRHQVIYI